MLSWQRPSTTKPEFAVLNAQKSACSPFRNKKHPPEDRCAFLLVQNEVSE
jgi:hypothetical protein